MTTAKSCTWNRIIRLGSEWLECSSAVKDMETFSLWRVCSAQVSNVALLQQTHTMSWPASASRPRDVIIPPYLAIFMPHLEQCPVLVPPAQERLEQDQQRATKTDHKVWEQGKVGWELCSFSLKKRQLKGDPVSLPKPRTQLQRWWKCFTHLDAQLQYDKGRKVLIRCKEKILHHENN